MPETFSRTLRSLAEDGPRRPTIVLAAGMAVLALWLAWFVLGRVAVFEVTERARLEVEKSAHPVAARVGGQVVATALRLGARVAAGSVLVELDAGREELLLAEARATRAGIEERLDARREEIRRQKEAAVAHREAGVVIAEERRAQLAAARASADLAEEKARTAATLHVDGAVSKDELAETRAEAASKREAARALELAVRRSEEEHGVEQLDRAAAIAALESSAVELAGQLAIEEAKIRSLEREVEVRRLRAPIDGVVGSAAELRAGSVVLPGSELGSIVPEGRPRVVAYFPVAAVGRLRAGQPARLRLDGFPWTQFGTPLATVNDVGTEPSQGRVRVELALDLDSAPAIPLEHGLTGSVEVEVERIAPAAVVLRAVARVLAAKQSPHEPEDSRTQGTSSR